ncbi:MAG: phosphotransferase [Myxococcota bacterium]
MGRPSVVEQQHLAEIVRTLFPGGELKRWEPLAGGVSATVIALEIRTQTSDLETVVLRQHGSSTWKELEDDVTAAEFGVLTALHRAGFPVPKPLHLDGSGSVLPSPFFVMEQVVGTTEVPEPRRPEAVCRMAETLAQLHGLETSTLSLPTLPPRVDPIPELLQYLPTFLELRREEIAARQSTYKGPTVLLHGDYWTGNLLWSDGSIVAVIDWEDTAVGDPCSELAQARLELQWRWGEDATRRFTERYLEASTIDLDLARLPLWELYVAATGDAFMEHWGLAPEVEANMRAVTQAFMRDAAARLR